MTMKFGKWRTMLALGAVAASAAACAGAAVQNTSGHTYLAGEPRLAAPARTTVPKGDTVRTATFNDRLRAAAAVEPRLTFPARIGLARLENGRLSAIPPEEADAWMRSAQALGPRFGEFVPVSPLIAELAASELPPDPAADRYYSGELATTVQKLRLGAARQHLHAVLVYEVVSHDADSDRDRDRAGPRSVAVLGTMMMPSREVKVEGMASAILLDVRNGYPYGTATARADDRALPVQVATTGRVGDLGDRARSAAVIKLAVEVERMAEMLYARRMRPAR